MNIRDLFRVTGIPVFFSSLCCLGPLVLVLFGLSTVSFASSLADTFYGSYKWYFRFFGLFLLSLSLFFYFRGKGICTLDHVKRHRRKVINTVLVTFIVAVVVYIVWLYVIVHYLGVWFNLWSKKKIVFFILGTIRL